MVNSIYRIGRVHRVALKSSVVVEPRQTPLYPLAYREGIAWKR